MHEAELERKVREVQEKYGHLLTREAALAHLRAENAGAKANSNSFQARVLRIFAPYEFQKSGRKGKVCRLELEKFGLGERPMLVLWDSDVDKLQKGEIAAGDLIEISNAYVKEGEFHIGRQGSVKRVEKGSAADAKKAEREAKSEKLAIIKELKASGDELEALVDMGGKGGRLKLKGEKALNFLGIRQAHEGISLEALLELKRSHLVGKAVRI